MVDSKYWGLCILQFVIWGDVFIFTSRGHLNNEGWQCWNMGGMAGVWFIA